MTAPEIPQQNLAFRIFQSVVTFHFGGWECYKEQKNEMQALLVHLVTSLQKGGGYKARVSF